MPRGRFTGERVAFALRRAEGGTPIGEVCRRMGGVGGHASHRWRKVYAGMGVAGIRRRTAARGGRAIARHRSEPDDDGERERLVADPSLDGEVLRGTR